jgi:Chromatin-associated proteins containing the HMG domain
MTTSPKKTTKKATGKPKRGRTSYIYFSMDVRKQVEKENPKATFTEIPKIIAAKWAQASPAIKKKYNDMAEKDKLRYQREMASYVPDPTTEKKKRRVRDPDAPKKALSAYNIFVKTQMAKNRPAGSTTGAIAALGAQWKSMSDKEKQPFVAAAQKDKARVERERGQ